MVTHTRPLPVAGGFFTSIKTLVHIIYCFVMMYLFLLVFLIPILLMICFRSFLSIIFITFHKGKYRLIEAANACMAMDRFANTCTLNFFCYIDGPCGDISLLRKRIHTIFTTFKGKNGSQPYEVMLCGIVKRCGFNCYENMRSTFDINQHIRLLPGCSDPNKIYSETEVFEAAASLADDLWDESRPWWEFLVVPKFKKDGSGQEICSAIHLRLHHIYVDGISSAQLIRLCVADKPAPSFIFDPVRPPIPSRKSFWLKLITFFQVIFLGPWASMKFMGQKEETAFDDGPLMGGKYFGRTTMDIPVNKMQEIRRFYGCSTTAIQHYVYTGAMRKLAESKGYSVPDQLLASLIYAFLPYPHEYPQNHVSFGVLPYPIGKSGLDRLYAGNKVCSQLTHPINYYALVTSRLFLRIVGVFPAVVVLKTMGALQISYYVSNVPGIKDIIYFNGNKVPNVFGTGPILNGIRYGTGVTCYENKFAFGFISEKSKLIASREDFNFLIESFESEMKCLMDSASKDAC